MWFDDLSAIPAWLDAATGIDVLRFDVVWDHYDEKKLAHIIELLAERSILPLVMLGGQGSPAWAKPDPRAYALVAERVADMLPNDAYMEIWNEPNLGKYWGGTPSPEEYAWLAFLATAAIPPRIYTMAGAVVFNDQKFIERLLAARPAARFDYLSIHPYTNDQPPDQRIDAWYSFALMVEQTQAKLENHPARLAITEVGWSATADARSASYYRAARDIANGIDLFCGYHLGDRPEAERSYALLSPDRKPTLSYRGLVGPEPLYKGAGRSTAPSLVRATG
jgi:hypothetical protein